MTFQHKQNLTPSKLSPATVREKPNRTPQHVTCCVVAAVALATVVASAIAQGMSHQATPAEVPSLFDPEQAKAHAMTQEQRWQLDFELANEIGMMDHNSWRFMPPNSFEKRARWYEETAKYYRIADLLQQIVDFRRSAMRNNEKAFNELVQLGEAGDAGAACMAALLYQSHRPELTKTWSYTHDDVARKALRYDGSGNRVCVATWGTVHFFGLLGETKDLEKAKDYALKAAQAGFFGSQRYMALAHLEGAWHLNPADFGAYMCWTRVTYQQSPISSFPLMCESQLAGTVLDHNIKRVPITDELLQITRRWCDPQTVVTAQTCADLERRTNQSGR